MALFDYDARGHGTTFTPTNILIYEDRKSKKGVEIMGNVKTTVGNACNDVPLDPIVQYFHFQILLPNSRPLSHKSSFIPRTCQP